MPKSKTPPSPETTPPSTGNLFVVGVGASAGGLEALSDFLSHLPQPLGQVAIIVVQHLSPTYKSMLVQLLSKQTILAVEEAKNNLPVVAGKVYITPPDSEISIEGGHLHLSKPLVSIGPKPSVDSFFYSLAEDCRERAVGIILSGTGSDGAKGIRRLKEMGGHTLAQEPQTAKYDGMPISAIETGQVDAVLPPDRMGEELAALLSDPDAVRPMERLPEIKTDSLQQIFKLLSSKTGTDFSQYKPTTILRRLEKRLDALHLSDVDNYLSYIGEHPDEVETLFKMILIGVTSFFRDTEAFLELEKSLAKIIATKNPGEGIRIWAPGCASGEEAYSIAILLSKLLGNRLGEYHVQIFATDIDDRAISFARRGIYPEQTLIHLPAEITETYFAREGSDYKLSKRLRGLVMFSKHDVTNNPPFVKLDLISCRNLLIYFSTALQKHVIPLFHYALNPNGYLFLGKSENIGQFSDLFSNVDSRNKIFQRKQVSGLHTIRFSPFTTRLRTGLGEAAPREVPEFSVTEMVKETLFSTFEHPYVVINTNMDVVQINGDVRVYLGLQQGNMNANIVKMAQPELQLDLRTTISRAIKDHLPATSAVRRFSFFGKDFFVRLVVKPLLQSRHHEDLYLVIFEQKEIDSPGASAPDKVQFTENERIIELEQELAATKEQLQAFIEELETSNEELQSLNEELQSANEELQSGNEELETTNEELQSTNEEMQIAYAELRTSNDALERQELRLRESDKHTRALLNNTLQSSMLIDRHYKILAFNRVAADKVRALTGRELQEGRPVIDYLVPGELEDFQRDFQMALQGRAVGGERTQTPAQGQQQYWFRYYYSPVPNDDGPVEVISYSLLDISEEQRAKQRHNESEQLLRAIFNHTEIGIHVVDENGQFMSVNPGYSKMLGYSPDELLGKHFTVTIPPELQAESLERFNRALAGQTVVGETRMARKNGLLIEVFKTKTLLRQADGRRLVLSIVRDITETRKYRNLLQAAQAAVRVGGWEYDLITHEMYWTDEVYQLYGQPRSFTPDLAALAAPYEVEARAFLLHALQKATEQAEPFDVELKFTAPEGGFRWARLTCKPVSVYGRAVKLFGTLQDVTAQKEQDLFHQKIASVAMQTANAVVITNAAGYTEWVNPSFEKMTGYAAAEVLGKKPGQLLQGPDTDPATVARIAAKLAQGESFYEEILNYRKDGRPYRLGMEITPVRNPVDGQISHFISVQSDVTQRQNG
ncbi:MAG: PAS domain S-box protein [Bernardetiaceae bacterium]|jgi:two-component system CheB/CheR fusion protein|nr:PAS domain S-box protein [Bernardetiaceae bacterium]